MVIECYFSTDDISKIISEQIFEAKKRIFLAMYTLTDRGLINALKEKRQNGTDVLAIFDEDQLARFSDIILELNNADIVFKTIGKEVARMHHKFLIIDDIKVITGSFNWTHQANKSNMENIMIVENQNIAKEYISEFDRIWQLISSRGIGNYLTNTSHTNRKNEEDDDAGDAGDAGDTDDADECIAYLEQYRRFHTLNELRSILLRDITNWEINGQGKKVLKVIDYCKKKDLIRILPRGLRGRSGQIFLEKRS